MSSALNIRPCRFSEIYLPTDSASFDLHNCFDFAGFSYDTIARTARLRWIRNEYAAADQPPSVVIEMLGVTHFSAKPRIPGYPFLEDRCLSSVGGVGPSDLTLEVYPDVPVGSHHVFTFMSGFVLRIGAESVCLLPHDI